ncbi:hypothetical protein MJO28_017304 [Puccinia striiformis f. sp. tritici]|nr:hypothetical protein MJO28_017304 [Puccinia striiformis f. sp. tritici]
MNAREEEEQAKLPFTWNQTLQHLGLNIPAPPRTKAHDLVMEISKTKLKVGLKGKEEILDKYANGKASVRQAEKTEVKAAQLEMDFSSTGLDDFEAITNPKSEHSS